MDCGLKNRVAIVTGASKGIGFASAKRLAAEGAKVLLISRDEPVLAAATAEIQSLGGIAAFLAGDVVTPALPEAAFNKAISLWGRVDILVNNSGGPPMGTFLEFDSSKWEQVIQANLMASIRFTQAVVPFMKIQRWGRIVTVSSTVAKEPSPIMVLSATTRAAIAAFTKAIAIELAPFNICANVVCPGGVLTDRLGGLLKTQSMRDGVAYEQLLKNSQASIPAQRFASPDELANVIAFLSSELSSYVTGVNLSVDGGLTKGFT